MQKLVNARLYHAQDMDMQGVVSNEKITEKRTTFDLPVQSDQQAGISKRTQIEQGTAACFGNSLCQTCTSAVIQQIYGD